MPTIRGNMSRPNAKTFSNRRDLISFVHKTVTEEYSDKTEAFKKFSAKVTGLSDAERKRFNRYAKSERETIELSFSSSSYITFHSFYKGKTTSVRDSVLNFIAAGIGYAVDVPNLTAWKVVDARLKDE
jgi:hypothetical protein